MPIKSWKFILKKMIYISRKIPVYEYAKYLYEGRQVTKWGDVVRYILPHSKSAEHISLISNKNDITSSIPINMPNLFCIGVQKSATSYICSVLAGHPAFAMVSKDSGVMDRFFESNNPDELKSLFDRSEMQKEVRAVFDVGYMYFGKIGADLLRKCYDDAPKILICLRDPVERMISDYRMRIRTILDTGLFAENNDFYDALALESERKLKVPAAQRSMHAYREESLYYDRVRAYIDLFASDNVHVVVMENDLVANDSVAFAKLFNFISLLDPDGVRLSLLSHDRLRDITKSPKNIDVTITTKSGRKIYNPESESEYGDEIIKRIRVTSDVPSQLNFDQYDPPHELVDAAVHLNRRIQFSPSLSEKRDIFEQNFKNDVEKLEQLLGADLSIWYNKYKSWCVNIQSS